MYLPSLKPTYKIIFSDVFVTAVASGYAHTCAATIDGSVWCWGYNEDGQLGDGDTDEQDYPVLVSLDAGVCA